MKQTKTVESEAEEPLLQGPARRQEPQALKSLKLPQGFRQSLFKSQLMGWGRGHRTRDLLVHGSPTADGREQAASQGLTLSGGLGLCAPQVVNTFHWGVGGFTSAKQLRKCASDTVILVLPSTSRRSWSRGRRGALSPDPGRPRGALLG